MTRARDSSLTTRTAPAVWANSSSFSSTKVLVASEAANAGYAKRSAHYSQIALAEKTKIFDEVKVVKKKFSTTKGCRGEAVARIAESVIKVASTSRSKGDPPAACTLAARGGDTELETRVPLDRPAVLLHPSPRPARITPDRRSKLQAEDIRFALTRKPVTRHALAAECHRGVREERQPILRFRGRVAPNGQLHGAPGRDPHEGRRTSIARAVASKVDLRRRRTRKPAKKAASKKDGRVSDEMQATSLPPLQCCPKKAGEGDLETQTSRPADDCEPHRAFGRDPRVVGRLRGNETVFEAQTAQR